MLQLGGGGACPADVAGRDRDLDLRLQQRRALQLGVRWSLLRRHPHRVLEGVPDGGGRRGGVSSGEMHQREARLGVPPGAVSGQQRFLGARDVALVQPDPSELVQRPAQLASQVGPQLLARQQRLSLCLVARPAEPEHLGAVHPAAPLQAPDRIRLAPPLHRLGPLLGHVVLGEALQGAHELAEDHPGRERIEVPGDRRDPGFVEQRQSLLHIAVQDEQPGFCHPSDGMRSRIMLRARLDGTLRPLPSAGRVAGQHPLVGADDRNARVRRRLTPAFEKPVGACQPAPHRRHEGGVEEQVHRDASGRACGGDLVPGEQARCVGTLPGLDGHVEVAGRVGDLPERR